VSTSIEARVEQIASDVFGVPVDAITPASSPDSIVTWDSVAHLTFTLALEQELGIQFEPDELEQMQSIGVIIELAQRRVDAGP
jgi:acyl carrier protein